MCSPVPGRPRQLALQHLADVGLHHDLRVEVVPGVEVEVLVRLAREAVDAGVAAAPVRVDRPSERHARRFGNAVQRRSGGDLVEGDPAELGGVESSRHRPAWQQRRRPARRGAVVVGEPKRVPPHASIRTHVRVEDRLRRRHETAWVDLVMPGKEIGATVPHNVTDDWRTYGTGRRRHDDHPERGRRSRGRWCEPLRARWWCRRWSRVGRR